MPIKINTKVLENLAMLSLCQYWYENQLFYLIRPMYLSLFSQIIQSRIAHSANTIMSPSGATVRWVNNTPTIIGKITNAPNARNLGKGLKQRWLFQRWQPVASTMQFLPMQHCL